MELRRSSVFMDELSDSYLYLTTISENETTTQYTLKWTVRDYTNIVANKSYSCHYIRIGKELHRLRILKYESRPRNDSERKRFYLFLGVTPTPSCVDVKISILGRRNQEIEAECVGRNSRRNCFFEFNESSIFLSHGGDLIAFCNIFVSTTGNKVLVGLKYNMFPNFEHLYDSKLFSDMIVSVGNKIFNIHRLVLAARSPVFEVMFQNKMRENSENKLVIEDSDEETFEVLLRYFYTGETGPLNTDLALNLLVLADKYDVPELKAEIADYLKCEISIENALAILTEAYLHNATELENEAVEFVGINLRTLMSSSNWKEFRNHSDLIDCILAYMC